MHGIPANLTLAPFEAGEVIQVCLGLHQVQFHFHPTGSISLEGGWELLAADGTCIDRRYHGLDRPPYQLHRLLGRRVVGSEVAAPKWFALRFEGGEVLRVFDDVAQGESFSIEPGNNFI